MESAVQVGVGLPTTVPGAAAGLVVEWARTVEAGPFSSLGVLDRLVYPSYEPLAVLAAAAAVTQRVRLVTMIVASPLRNTVLLAKEVATIDALSGGRLVLGVALGARKEDYDAAGVDYRSRGRRLAEQLADLRVHWEDESLAPPSAQAGGPPILVGGLSDQTFARVARYADGYVHGGGPPRHFARSAEKVRAAWSDAGRPDRPQLWAQGYYILGDDAAVAAGQAYLRDYYAFTGPFAERIAAGLLTTPQAIVQFIRGYAEAGCDELVLLPVVAEIDQVTRLGEVVAGFAGRAA